MRLVARNWCQFQHYKTRNPPWIKLYRSLLDDFDFQALPDASRALAPMLWLLASESEGVIEATSVEKLAFRLRRTENEIRVALYPLVKLGFFECDTVFYANGSLNASVAQAPRKQDACPETEEETEKMPTGGVREDRLGTVTARGTT